jgi:tryptophan synthase
VFSYGEQAAVVEAKEAGANGFLITDLPFEEAFQFQVLCARSGWVTYVAIVIQNKIKEI